MSNERFILWFSRSQAKHLLPCTGIHLAGDQGVMALAEQLDGYFVESATGFEIGAANETITGTPAKLVSQCPSLFQNESYSLTQQAPDGPTTGVFVWNGKAEPVPAFHDLDEARDWIIMTVDARAGA